MKGYKLDFFKMLFVAKGPELHTGFEQCENNPFLLRRYSEVKICITFWFQWFSSTSVSNCQKAEIFIFHFLWSV